MRIPVSDSGFLVNVPGKAFALSEFLPGQVDHGKLGHTFEQQGVGVASVLVIQQREGLDALVFGLFELPDSAVYFGQVDLSVDHLFVPLSEFVRPLLE